MDTMDTVHMEDGEVMDGANVDVEVDTVDTVGTDVALRGTDVALRGTDVALQDINILLSPKIFCTVEFPSSDVTNCTADITNYYSFGCLRR